MSLFYKLVTQDYTTLNNTKWKIGKTVFAAKGEAKLCSPTVVHSYSSPELAVLLNPIHANIKNPRMLVCEAPKAIIKDWGKNGHEQLTPIKEIELPVFSREQKVYFAILCAMQVYKEPTFILWAESWITGKDRTSKAARSAAAYAADAANANAAAYAARSAARSDAAAYTARSAAHAAAAHAADAAIHAAADATFTKQKINFNSLAKQAYKVKL